MVIAKPGAGEYNLIRTKIKDFIKWFGPLFDCYNKDKVVSEDVKRKQMLNERHVKVQQLYNENFNRCTYLHM